MDNAKSDSANNKQKCTSWKKRTLLERYLILLCLALFIGLISLIGVNIFYRYAHRIPTRRICNSPACKREAGRLLKNMDSSVNPCDDFYNFACGSFMKYERITDERVHSLMEGEEYILRYSRDTIEEADENTGPEFVKKLKKLYYSCLKKPTDTSEIIMELLNKTNLGSFPIYDDVVGEKITIEEVLAITTIFSGGENPLFRISNYRDTIQLGKGRSSIDLSKILDTTDDDVRMRKEKYIDLLTSTQFHSAKPRYNMGDEAYEIVDFHTSLVNITSQMRNESEVVMETSELYEICPEIKWMDFLKHIYEAFGHSDEVASLSERNTTVDKISYIKDMCQLISVWGSGVVQNFLVWNFLAQSLLHFDPSFHKSFGEIDPVYIRRDPFKHYPIKWKNCINSVQQDVIFDAGLNYLVIERMKPEKNLEEIEEYVNNIKEVMDRVLLKEDWLNEPSRKILRNQLIEFVETIGYDETSIDINLLEKQFQKFIVSDNYIDNWLQNRKTLCSEDFFEKVILVAPDSLALPLYFGSIGGGNSITIPLGLLVPPVFTPDVPKYLNYGSIGFLIAHEISHSFDHAEFFEVLGMSPETLAIFKKKSECYVRQYSALPLDENGVMVNGEFTIRDNIADNSGITQAFSAYIDYVEREGQEESIPGLNYTNRQIFFIKYAQMWCEILESPAKTYKPNEHSPGKYRTLEPLKNFPSFAEEFNCRRGSFMNPQHKCRMWG